MTNMLCSKTTSSEPERGCLEQLFVLVKHGIVLSSEKNMNSTRNRGSDSVSYEWCEGGG